MSILDGFAASREGECEGGKGRYVVWIFQVTFYLLILFVFLIVNK